MITTEFFLGQGLGNMLACYVTTRCIALDLGYNFGMAHPERFKGSSFLKNLDFGKKVEGGVTPVEGKPPTALPNGITNYYVEKTQRHPNGSDISSYDWDLFKVSDNTKIDGLMQGENYFKKYKEKIKTWLKVDLIDMPENLCIINFRGGEYVGIKEVFLTRNYWDNAINNMRKIRSDIQFQVVTDDPETAKSFFDSDMKITHSMDNDYISIQSAPYLILSNSSFGFFPAWLNENLKFCIAPRFWSRHNVSDGYWSMDQNFTEGWHYQDRQGNLNMNKVAI